MANVMYDLLVGFLRLVTRVFFRTVEVVGLENVPEKGPVIFMGNHPNSLIDPVLIITSCGRRVRFAAKDKLFESRALRVVLNILGAVPIRRRQDHKGATGPLDNTEAFRALFDILREGEAFGIFPEGISHASSELAPLKTGAARIALGADGEDIPVTLIPCGLCYRKPWRLRSRVLVQFGAPVPLDEALRETHKNDEREAARALTDDISLGMRALTINTEDFDTLRVLDGVRRLYTPKGARLSLAKRAELTRRFIEAWEQHRSRVEVGRLYEDVSAYVFKLSALGLRDADLTRTLHARVWFWKVVAHMMLMVLWFPLALPGVIIHAPILVAAVFAGEALTSRRDVRATTKLISATFLTLSAYAVIIASFVWFLPWPTGAIYAPAVLVALLLSGWATIRVLERQSVLRKGISVLVLLMDLKAELRRLAKTREELRDRVLAVVDKLIDPDMERIVAVEGNE